MSKDAGVAHIGKVTPEMCVGHFHDDPALPVAVLMDRVNRLATTPSCTRGQIDAEHLAFAGQDLVFSVKFGGMEGNLAHYEGYVRSVEGDVFAQTTFRYTTESQPR